MVNHDYIINAGKSQNDCTPVMAASTKEEAIEKAKELLPTQSGFFFGGTDYDEYYFEDVKDAADLMQSFLDNFDFEKYQLVYRASW